MFPLPVTFQFGQNNGQSSPQFSPCMMPHCSPNTCQAVISDLKLKLEAVSALSIGALIDISAETLVVDAFQSLPFHVSQSVADFFIDCHGEGLTWQLLVRNLSDPNYVTEVDSKLFDDDDRHVIFKIIAYTGGQLQCFRYVFFFLMS